MVSRVTGPVAEQSEPLTVCRLSYSRPEEQIIGILKQHEAGRKVPELESEIGVRAATIYIWEWKYGRMDVSDNCRICLRFLPEPQSRLMLDRRIGFDFRWRVGSILVTPSEFFLTLLEAGEVTAAGDAAVRSGA